MRSPPAVQRDVGGRRDLPDAAGRLGFSSRCWASARERVEADDGLEFLAADGPGRRLPF
jgi:hypothetical protein